jgi:hypothetical protein
MTGIFQKRGKAAICGPIRAMTAADQLQASPAPFSLLHELPVLTEAVVPARYADWRPCPKNRHSSLLTGL